MPSCEATSPDCCIAIPSSPTSAADLFAPAARTSATWTVWSPAKPHVFNADADIAAALPRSSWPAAASDRAPERAPFNRSGVPMPAFTSSVWAWAASVAEKLVSAPARIACCRNNSRSPADADATADSSDIWLLKSAVDFVAAAYSPPPIANGATTAPIAAAAPSSLRLRFAEPTHPVAHLLASLSTSTATLVRPIPVVRFRLITVAAAFVDAIADVASTTMLIVMSGAALDAARVAAATTRAA